MGSFWRAPAAAASSTLGLLLTGCMLLTGCAADDTKKETTGGVDIDQLWRDGYGFNNPNPERKRKGLPPVDFSGRVSRPKASTSSSSPPTITLPPVKLKFD